MALFHLALALTTSARADEITAVSVHHMIHQVQWRRKATVTIDGPDAEGQCTMNPAAGASPRALADEVLRVCSASGYTIVEDGDYVHLVSGDPADRVLDRTISLTPGLRPLEEVLAEVVQQLSATLGPDDKPFFGDGSISGGINGAQYLTRVEVPAGGPTSARAWLRMVPVPVSEWWAPMGLPIVYRARVVWMLTEGPDTVSLQVKVVDQTDYLEDNEVWLGSRNQQRPTKLAWLQDRLQDARANPSPSYGPADIERAVAMYERLIAEEEARLLRGAQSAP
jgi:hypothetical protein